MIFVEVQDKVILAKAKGKHVAVTEIWEDGSFKLHEDLAVVWT